MKDGERRSHPRLDPPRGLRAFVVEGDPDVVLITWTQPRHRVTAALTAAETAVLEYVRAGLSNAEIARRRGRSPRTVANQIARVFEKLGVRSRLELFAVMFGRRAGRARSAED